MNSVNKLWTKDFTIITVGSFISMLGNNIAGFAMGLLVLDYTKSTLLYALYEILFTAPQVIVPIISGPFVDKFSRKKTIYTLDFISAAIYALFALFLYSDKFNFVVLATGCLILGCIQSIYTVTYTSFYPLLISEGNYSKAYSISSILETLTGAVIPLSAVLYNTIGMEPLLAINAISFLLAAIMETQIKQREEYHENRISEKFTIHKYFDDFKNGLKYLKVEKGLLVITIYFMFSSLAGGAENVLMLPYFKNNFENGEYIFILIGAGIFFGRLIGGSVYYKFNFPDNRKYNIAFIVYVCTCFFEAILLYTPLNIMFVLSFLSGIMGVTSYNIRISATQSYVPDDKKGRFNGTFQMLCTTGALLGQLLAGSLSIYLNERVIILVFMSINLLAAIFAIGANKNKVAKIYNRTA